MLGTTISHYRVLQKLGGGGMGVVYEAEDLKLHRRVALKFLPENLASDVTALRRFEREAQAASALNHPNICTIYDIDTSDGRTFIAMELLEGKTLKHTIRQAARDNRRAARHRHPDRRRPGRSPLRRHHPSRHQAGEHLCHQARSGKGAGFRTGEDGPSATRGSNAGRDGDGADPASGDAIGTLVYMSPEQVRGRDLDARTDLFSFGILLYEMTTGTLPFRGSTSGAVSHSILSDSPPAPVRLNPDVPPKLEEIINKALEKDRELRYQHAADLCSDLKRLKRETQSGPTVAASATSGTTLRPGKRIWSTVVPVGLVALAIAAGAFFYSRRVPALTQKDTIVLADFDNRTGDPVFDDTLKQALAVGLEQSPFLNVLSDQKVNARCV